MELKSRLTTNYTGQLKIIYKLWAKVILDTIELNHEEGISRIYQNQEVCSMEIVAKLTNTLIISVLIIALTQSGKTGTMVALIENYLKTNLIPKNHIYIITGLSSCEWKEQTKERMPNDIQKNVYHRGNHTVFLEDIKDKSDVLIIIDEIQIAAKENQSLFKIFTKLGFYDKQTLLSKNIKIVQFTATPDGIIYDLNEWGEHSCTLRMTPGEGYISCFDLLNKNRIRQFKDLCCYNKTKGEVNYKNLKENMEDFLKDFNSFKKSLYHIIRVKNGDMADIMIDNFKRILNDDSIIYKTYYEESDMKDINKLLEKEPGNHTFIFVKEKLRCAKTLDKKYCGIIYERYVDNPDDATIIQGLLGRFTGYDDNQISIIYTNIDTIERYKELWENNFDSKKIKNIKWKSKTTKKQNMVLKSKGTYNSTEFFNGMNSSSEDSEEEKQLIIKKFNKWTDVIIYVESILNKNKPKHKSKKYKENGFWKNHIRGKTEVMNEEQVMKDCKWGINKSHRIHYVYKDKTDKSTLEYWVIHYQ